MLHWGSCRRTGRAVSAPAATSTVVSTRLCALSELKNRLRAGDLYVVGSRQFQDFEDYLLPTMVFRSMRSADRLGLDVPTTADEYLWDRLTLLREALEDTNRLAGADELPDARINDKGLKISPLEDDTPPEAKLLKSQTYGLLPPISCSSATLLWSAGYARKSWRTTRNT